MAYRSAPIRCRETEAWVPPLDLYLNKRLADFEARLRKKTLQLGARPGEKKTTTGHLVTEACNRVYHRFRRKKAGPGQKPRQGPQGPTPTEQATIIVGQWADQRWKAGEKKNKKLTTSEVVELAWQARWEQQRAGQQGTSNRRIADEDPPIYQQSPEEARRPYEGPEYPPSPGPYRGYRPSGLPV